MKLINRIVLGVGWIFALLLSAFLVFVFVIFYLLEKRSIDLDDVSSSASRSAVGVLELKGEIFSSEPLREQLEGFLSQKKIKAIVLRIDSPGGTLGASEEIFSLLKKADEKKPVVCSMGSIAASGGLYVANACRKIFANKGTITGSIGVIFMSPYLGDVLERFGLEMNVVKSGRYKDAGSPFRKLGDDDRQILQEVADQGYEQFLDVISKSRQIPRAKLSKFADGRIFLGEKAFELGLVDQLGDLDKAARLALELAGVKDVEPELVMAKEEKGFFAFFRNLPNSRIFHRLDYFLNPKLLYR